MVAVSDIKILHTNTYISCRQTVTMAEGKQKRVKPHLLEDIEKHDGDNFTEQLMNWKNSSDELSTEELENQVDEAIESFERKIDKLAKQESDEVSTEEDPVDYIEIENIVEKQVEKVMKRMR